ncbi:MAG: hypothetical protein U5Q44_14345 [Dehalococcoidia bacterium]|nr:hypothetical protein [Dehalococcoidia bacterium]
METFTRFGRNILPGEDTILHMVFEDEYASPFEPGTGGEQLGEDILAGAALFEHAPERTDLTFDPGEAVKQAFIGDVASVRTGH